MRYKRNSFKDKIIIMLLVLTSIYLILNNFPNKQHSAVIQDDKEYKTLTYTITEIEIDGYYGKSEDGKTQIYFTSEDIRGEEQIQVDDVVLAYFEPDNLIKLIGVEKVNE